MSHRFGTYKTLASTLESDMLESLKFIWNHSRKTIKKKNMSKKDDLKPYTLPLQCCHCIFRCERWTCSKILNECGQLASYQKCSYFIGQMYARDEQMMTWSHLWGPNSMSFFSFFYTNYEIVPVDSNLLDHLNGHETRESSVTSQLIKYVKNYALLQPGVHK